MGLGAVNAAPCVHGRRSARGAVNKRPQVAARANHRRHSAPLRAPQHPGEPALQNMALALVFALLEM